MKKNFMYLFLLLLSCAEEYDGPNHTPGIVKVFDCRVFTAYGEGGLFITDIASDEVLAHVFPSREMNSIDDFDVDGNLLFVLDSRNKDYMAVYSIQDIQNPTLVDGPVNVNGGPFNGLSAKGGNVVVAGGTFFLEYFQYSPSGKLRGRTSFGRDRGHPDILLSDNGQVAFVSTDFEILPDVPRFGVLALSLGDQLNIPGVISEHKIEGAGFTQGTTMPVGFPIQLKVYQDYLLVAHGGGLTIIELIEDSAFGQANTFDLGIEATAIETFNKIAYIVGFTNDTALLKVDLTDINNPIITDTEILSIGSNVPTSVAVNDQFVFIAAGQAGLLKMSN